MDPNLQLFGAAYTQGQEKHNNGLWKYPDKYKVGLIHISSLIYKILQSNSIWPRHIDLSCSSFCIIIYANQVLF